MQHGVRSARWAFRNLAVGRERFAKQEKLTTVNREFVGPKLQNSTELLNHLMPEGAYIFKPDWSEPLP